MERREHRSNMDDHEAGAGNDGDACTHGRGERACRERRCCRLEEKTRERKERGTERGVAVLQGSW
jgi:hypothetical protein